MTEMREIDPGAGEHIDKACEKLVRAAPAFMVFNGVRVEAKVGDTAGDLHARWSEDMRLASEEHQRKRLAYEQTPAGKAELALAQTRSAEEKCQSAAILRDVAASGVRERFPWTDSMGEVSGFGGGYENACRDMIYAGIAWTEKHPGADLSTYKTVDAKALDAHILLACPDCSGAMHGAAMNALAFIAKQGWNAYAGKMMERAAKRVGIGETQ